MRFRIVNEVGLVVLILSVAACSSVPTPETSNSALLVVNAVSSGELANDIGIIGLYLVFEDGTMERINTARPDNITLISDMESGKVVTKAVRVSLKAGTVSSTGKKYIDYPLRIETTLTGGAYTIFPVIINYEGIKNEERQYTIRIGFSNIDSANLKKIEDALEAKGVYDYWSQP